MLSGQRRLGSDLWLLPVAQASWQMLCIEIGYGEDPALVASEVLEELVGK